MGGGGGGGREKKTQLQLDQRQALIFGINIVDFSDW